MPRPVRDGEINLHHPTSMFPLLPSVWSTSWQIRVQTITVVSGWKSSHIAKWLKQCNWSTPTVCGPFAWVFQSSLPLVHSRVERPKNRAICVISNRSNRGWTVFLFFLWRTLHVFMYRFDAKKSKSNIQNVVLQMKRLWMKIHQHVTSFYLIELRKMWFQEAALIVIDETTG